MRSGDHVYHKPSTPKGKRMSDYVATKLRALANSLREEADRLDEQERYLVDEARKVSESAAERRVQAEETLAALNALMVGEDGE